jgi:hypothetical protein
MTFDKHGEFDDDHVWIEVGYIMYLVLEQLHTHKRNSRWSGDEALV